MPSMDSSSVPRQVLISCIVLYVGALATLLVKGYRARLPFSRIYKQGLVRLSLFPHFIPFMCWKADVLILVLANASMESYSWQSARSSSYS